MPVNFNFLLLNKLLLLFHTHTDFHSLLSCVQLNKYKFSWRLLDIKKLPLITANSCLYLLTGIASRQVINVFKLFFLIIKIRGCREGPHELWENWLVCDEKSIYRELSV